MDNASNESLSGQGNLETHPRVMALSEGAMKMYVALLHYAAPDGSVVQKRVDELCLTVDLRSFYELLASGLLNAEWYVWNPVVLDRAEALERAEVP